MDCKSTFTHSPGCPSEHPGELRFKPWHPFSIIIENEERETQTIRVKGFEEGNQLRMSVEELLEKLA